MCTARGGPLPCLLQALAWGFAVLVPESLDTATGCYSSTGGAGVNDQQEIPGIVQVGPGSGSAGCLGACGLA